MIQVFDSQVVLSESASKGNQKKFYNNGCWVKLDNQNCFEGLAEHFVSKFESIIYNFPYVDYVSDKIVYNDDLYNGCASLNMYDINTTFISLRRLFKKNNILLNIFIRDDDIRVNIRNVVDACGNLTGLDISSYLFRLVLLDSLILNEDRHYMNLGICSDGNSYYEAKCFDNGSSLFCTNWTYRKTKSLEENIRSASSVARPFSKFFDKQVSACISLGAKPLLINKKGLDILMMNYHNSFYSDERNNLVKSVLSDRLAYYYNKGVYTYV